MSQNKRDWVWEYVPVDMQDKGAYDEGYYYYFCNSCCRKTEHDSGSCCDCGMDNDPECWE